MAAHAVRLPPATQLHGGISGNLAPSNRKLNTFVRYGCGSSKRYRIVTVLASLREDDANGRDNSVRAMEVKKILEDSPLLPSTDSRYIFPLSIPVFELQLIKFHRYLHLQRINVYINKK